VHMLSTMERVMGGWAAMPARSPTILVARAAFKDSLPATVAKLSRGIPSCDVLSVATRVEGGDVDHMVDGSMHDAGSMHMLPGKRTCAGKEESAAVGVVTTLKRRRTGSDPDSNQKQTALAEHLTAWDECGWGHGLDSTWCSIGMRRRVSSERSVVPPSKLLDPPERKQYYSSFELAGDAIANRVGMAFGRVCDNAREVAAREETGKIDERYELLSWVGSDSLVASDAAERFAACLTCDVLKHLPPTVLMSGSKDFTVPWHESVEYYRVLCNGGVRARKLLYDDVGHAGFVMSWRPRSPHQTHASEDRKEGPKFMRDLVHLVTGNVHV
jgi:hypothetical protein